jgi:hypothetical protein
MALKVRDDRVGIYKLGVLAYVPMPLTSASYYDLWLTTDGIIGVDKVKSYQSDWPAKSIRDISEVREVGFREALTCYQGVMPSRMLHVRVHDQRYLILFTGITHFLSKSEKLIGHVPGVHHVGALLVEAKSNFNNRGSKARAIEARDVWFRVLTGQVNPSELPPLVLDS